MRVIDSHTEGEPTRLVVAGGPNLGSEPLAECRSIFSERHDGFWILDRAMVVKLAVSGIGTRRLQDRSQWMIRPVPCSSPRSIDEPGRPGAVPWSFPRLLVGMERHGSLGEIIERLAGRVDLIVVPACRERQKLGEPVSEPWRLARDMDSARLEPGGLSQKARLLIEPDVSQDDPAGFGATEVLDNGPTHVAILHDGLIDLPALRQANNVPAQVRHFEASTHEIEEVEIEVLGTQTVPTE